MNPDNQNLYSISDLADQVGVPRTTITDWLGKYARFIELQTQGRRRFYTNRTLSVLCKVAELRAAGRSIGDIDGELERIFPVHPTVEPPEPPEGTESEPAASVGPDAANQDRQTYPVMKQENSDELYDLLGTKFADLCDAMNAVNRKADVSARRLRLMLAAAVMIIVVLSGFLALFYVNFLVQRDNAAASRDAVSAISAFSAGSETRENALRADVGGLSGSVSGLTDSVSGMEGRMSGLTDTVSGMEGRMSGLTDSMSGMEGRMSGLTDSMSGMEGRMSGLAGSMSGMEGRMSGLTDTVSGMEGRMSGLTDTVSGMDGRVSGLADTVSGMDGRVSGLADTVSGMSGSVSGLAGSVSGMNDELQKLRADLPAQRAAFEAAIEELKRSSGSAMEAQQAQFEARIALEKEQFAAERLKLLQQIDSLQERLNQAAADNPARDEELRRLRDELAVQMERGKDVEKLNEELNILSGRINALREKNESLANDLAAANKRAAEAEARKTTAPNSNPQSGGYPRMQ